MTKQGEVRDWNKDMELGHTARYEYKLEHLNPVLDAYFYWMSEAAAEKERADRLEERNKALMAAVVADANGTFSCLAEEREKKLREAIEEALSWTLNCGEYTMTEVIAILRGVLASLYPDKEGEAK